MRGGVNIVNAVQLHTGSELPVQQSTAKQPTDKGFGRYKQEAFDRLGEPRLKNAAPRPAAPEEKEDFSDPMGIQAMAAQLQSEISDPPQELVSMCRGNVEMAQQLAGILEGFGLLNNQTDGTEIPQDIQQMLETYMQEQMQVDIPAATEELAVEAPQDDMVEENVLPKQDAQTIDQVADQLESLENTGNAQKTYPAGEAPQSQTQADDNGDSTAAPLMTAQNALPLESAPVEGQFQPQAAQAVSQQDMVDNITRMVDSITTAAEQGKAEMQVDLKPEYLGKLSISLVMDSEGLHAQIKAADLAAKSLIQTELPALQEMLRERGLPMAKVEVTYQAPTFNFSDNNSSQRQFFSNGRNNNSSRRFAAALPAEPYESIIQDLSGVMEDIFTANSSVEFRA